MREDFESVKAQVDIKNIATYLLGKPCQGMYRFPEERTPSIKLYPATNSFYDFGRGTGGDCVRLWSHVKGCDSWTALREIAVLYGISTDLNTEDGKSIAERIKAQEQVQKERERAEKCKRKQWVVQVDRLHEELELYENLLNSPHIPPLSWVWTWCMNGKQLAEFELDRLCGIIE